MRVTLERQRRKKFDVVILEHIFMAQYRNIFSDSLIVLHEHNIESSVLAQFAELKCSASLRESETLAAQVFADAAEESERLRAYEDAVWHDVDLRVTVSEQDKSVIDRRCPKGDTIVVPNGVAVDAVPFLPLAAPGTVLFMGTLDYYPNVDAIYFLVEHVLPLISTDVTMRIAGRNPSAGVRRLSHSSRIEVIPFPPRMEDIAADCRLVVVPLRIGGGSRLRIPHAFAMGRPIVSTRLGCAGYDVTAGQHLLTADTAAEFAEAVDVLMTDHALAAHLRQRARRLADRKLRWDALFGPLGDTITALAS